MLGYTERCTQLRREFYLRLLPVGEVFFKLSRQDEDTLKFMSTFSSFLFMGLKNSQRWSQTLNI
ncbi:hypothetical protein C1H46_012136 [Malus baccata]|uniref:Uncharacterized protein n=1 Tax=Malus baccata TaxID=106549 RepID=A0A540MTY9_MALBA|nr:hypothetical protein C1H46_012136 [Malus baccata]